MAKTKAFDEHSEDYEQWFDLNKYAYESELRAIRHFIPGRGKGVEIGIGSGLFASPLGITNGIEPSSQMREIASRRGLNVKEGVAENIPLEDSSIDYVLYVTTVCFVDDIEQSLKETWRILKEGGRVVIGFVDKESAIGQVYQENKQYSTFYREAKFFSAREMEELLSKLRFSNIEFVQTLFGELKNIDSIQDFQEGYGRGSFVVAKGEKTKK
ncbi:MAG: class I SAM-dependent methyltransferase [Bacteroidales bacterium]